MTEPSYAEIAAAAKTIIDLCPVAAEEDIWETARLALIAARAAAPDPIAGEWPRAIKAAADAAANAGASPNILTAILALHLGPAPAGPTPQVAVLRAALEELVKLQSHYAMLLNMHDGGKRLQFKSADEWLTRLAALSSAPEPMLQGESALREALEKIAALKCTWAEMPQIARAAISSAPGEEGRDARLIAAAPAMLAALKAIVHADNAPLVLSDSHSAKLIDNARAAIALAERPQETE